MAQRTDLNAQQLNYGEIVLGLLEDSGLVIETAEDGRQALDKFRVAPFDLILMDVRCRLRLRIYMRSP